MYLLKVTLKPMGYIDKLVDLSVADPVGGGGPGPPAPVKTSQKKMATTWGRKLHESLVPPSDKFLDPLPSLAATLYPHERAYTFLRAKWSQIISALSRAV